MLKKEYVKEVEQICKEKEILLIVDEVQTGVGRTGTFLCCEHYEVRPNVITLAKGLGAYLIIPESSSPVIPLASRAFLIACPIGVKSKSK